MNQPFQTKTIFRTTVAIAVFAMLLMGCASVDSAPGWVNGENPPEFEPREFVIALGSGATFAAAQVAAKSELSRVFLVSVKSEIELIDQEITLGDQVTSSSEIMIESTLSTELELQGAEVPLHWRDSRTGEVWALAVLQRSKECLRIRIEGRDLMTQQDGLAMTSRGEGNPLIAVRAALSAVRLGARLDELQARSRVLGSPCLDQRTNATGVLKTELETLMGRLSFVITTQDVDPGSGRVAGTLPQLREAIAENLTKMGFQVGPAEGNRVIPIDARLRLRRVNRGTNWIEYRWEGSAEIGSPVLGDPVVIAAESDGAESHPEDSTARLRARRKGERDLANQLDARLKAFLAAPPRFERVSSERNLMEVAR